jgi:isocitrate lyase
MLLLRSDCIKAEFVTSCIDPRDHEYIVGATAQNIEPFTSAMTRAIESGETNPVIVRKQWAQTAGLMTFDEAVKAQADSEDQYLAYSAEISKAGAAVSLAQRREKSRHALGKDVYFDWELPRSLQGQYMYKWSVKAAIERCLAAAPFGDLSWPRMDFPGEFSSIVLYLIITCSRIHR